MPREAQWLTLDKPPIVTSTHPTNHTVFLIRGLPGSGRSTLAKKLAGRSGLIISPEETLPRGFKPGPFTKEHNAQCYLIADTELRLHLEARRPTDIILDRPHLELWEMRSIVKLIQKHGYKVKVCPTKTPWSKDWLKCAKRTKHKIEPAHFADMAAKYEPGVSVAKILGSLTPLQKLDYVEKLWHSLPGLPEEERRTTERMIYRTYPRQLTTLIEKHGLLKAHGWPNTTSDSTHLRPLNT